MRLDALTLELLRNYLHGAVEDMAYAVERTAHTTFVKETADFTCGLLNPSGEFFAYPVELGVASMAGINYARTIELAGPLGHGDVIITNDPYSSLAAATHLPDLHLVRPIFWEGRLIAHGAGFLHCSDIGGLVPASISPRASEIFQEGLRLPPKKLFVGGAVNRDLLDVIMANCRIPEQNWGDLQALVAGLVTGERRIHALIQRFGIDVVEKGMDDLIDYTARKVEAQIRRMPRGTLRVHRLHRGRRRHRHPHPAQGGDDGGRRQHPSRLHGQRRPGGLGAERADGRARASVHGHRAVQLLHHQGPGHPAERGRAAPDPDDAPRGLGGEPAVPRGVRRPLRHRAADLRRRAGRARPRAPRGDPRGERRARAAWLRWRCPTSRPGAGTSP